MARIEERDYPAESRGNLTRRGLREISQAEVANFNTDYDALIEQETNPVIKGILEDLRELVFETTRAVMQRANQNYGGALAEGDEIGFLFLRPAHLDVGVGGRPGTVNTFDYAWGAPGTTDWLGTAAALIELGDNNQAEGMVVGAATDSHPAPKTEAIQFVKFNVPDVVIPLFWTALRTDRGPRITRFKAPFAAFPGESFRAEVRNAYQGDDELRPVGVYISVGTNLRTL
jgi:hypothetical protein